MAILYQLSMYSIVVAYFHPCIDDLLIIKIEDGISRVIFSLSAELKEILGVDLMEMELRLDHHLQH